MERWRVWLLAAVVAAVVAFPAAAGEKEKTGSQLSVVSAPATFAADEPFYVTHGWGFIPATGVEGTAPWPALAQGKLDFTLTVDGELVEPSYLEVSRENDILWRRWVYNFPSGLPAGEHTITGTWFGPCASMVRNGLYSGSCDKPTDVVIAVAPLTRTIEFTD